MSLHERSRRLRTALLLAIDRLPLDDSERVRELFEKWQRMARELGLLDAPRKKARR
ncbi:MAG TPA: hypothetical protein VNZ44_02865 [Pyrinomonadaceae bacterium]|nr:hypothetical protein [Pyrinomonadaceae bacterium]